MFRLSFSSLVYKRKTIFKHQNLLYETTLSFEIIEIRENLRVWRSIKFKLEMLNMFTCHTSCLKEVYGSLWRGKRNFLYCEKQNCYFWHCLISATDQWKRSRSTKAGLLSCNSQQYEKLLSSPCIEELSQLPCRCTLPTVTQTWRQTKFHCNIVHRVLLSAIKSCI